MAFGLPTPSRHTCGPRPGGTLPISITMGPIVILDLVGQKFCIMIKYYKFRAINGKSRSKMPPEADDEAMGVLAATRRLKMANRERKRK